jgi:hypothetical protein
MVSKPWCERPRWRERDAGLCFVIPLTLVTATAILAEPWAHMLLVLAILLVAQGAILGGLLLSGRPRAVFPAGLSLS